MKPPELTFELVQGKYIYYSFYADDGRAKNSTGLQITKEQWQERATKPFPRHVKNAISLITTRVENYVTAQRNAVAIIEKEEVERIVRDSLNLKDKKSVPKIKLTIDIIDLFAKYIKAIEDGEITTKEGKRLGKSSLRTRDAIFKKMKAYPIEKDIRKVDDQWLALFKKYLINDKKKLSQNTLSAYISILFHFGRESRKLGWHKNDFFKTEGLGVPPEDVDYAIALNNDELDILYHLPLDHSQRLVIDYFCFGSLTALRGGDVLVVGKDAVKNNMINISPDKTDNPVWVPLSPRAIEILERNNYSFGNLSESTLRKRIKLVAKEIGLNEMCLWQRTEGGVVKKEYRPKWEMVSPHTMRRSFATNLYLETGDPLLCMKFTGHKSLKSFLKYVKVKQEEMAKRAENLEFFKK